MYITGIHTDHSAFFLGCEIRKYERGPSYWKFNTSLLQDPVFIEKMNLNIEAELQKNKDADDVEQWKLLKKAIKKTQY